MVLRVHAIRWGIQVPTPSYTSQSTSTWRHEICPKSRRVVCIYTAYNTPNYLRLVYQTFVRLTVNRTIIKELQAPCYNRSVVLTLLLTEAEGAHKFLFGIPLPERKRSFLVINTSLTRHFQCFWIAIKYSDNCTRLYSTELFALFGVLYTDDVTMHIVIQKMEITQSLMLATFLLTMEATKPGIMLSMLNMLSIHYEPRSQKCLNLLSTRELSNKSQNCLYKVSNQFLICSQICLKIWDNFETWKGLSYNLVSIADYASRRPSPPRGISASKP